MTRKGIFDKLKASFTINTWLNYGITLLGFSLVTLLVVGRLPAEEVAVWLLFNSLISISNLVDFGFSPVITRQYSYCVKNLGESEKKYNWELIEKVYGLSGIIYLILGVAFIGVGYLFYITSISFNIEKTKQADTLSIAYLILISGLTISFYGKKYLNTLTGLGEVPKVNRINAFFNLVKYLIAASIFYFHESILLLVIVYQTVNILIVLKNYILLRRDFPEFMNFSAISFDRSLFPIIFSPAWRGALGMIGSVGVIEVSGHIFSMYGQTEDVANYLFAYRIIIYISLLSNVPFYSKLPIWNSLRMNGALNELRAQSFKSINLVAVFFSLSIFSSALIIPFFLEFIGSDLDFVSVDLWLFMGLVFFLERHHGIHAHLFSTTNKEPFYIPVMITGIIYLTMLYVLRDSMNAWTIIISYFSANLLINNWWNVYISLKSLETTMLNYLRKVKITVVCFALFIVLSLVLILIKEI